MLLPSCLSPASHVYYLFLDFDLPNDLLFIKNNGSSISKRDCGLWWARLRAGSVGTLDLRDNWSFATNIDGEDIAVHPYFIVKLLCLFNQWPWQLRSVELHTILEFWYHWLRYIYPYAVKNNGAPPGKHSRLVLTILSFVPPPLGSERRLRWEECN